MLIDNFKKKKKKKGHRIVRVPYDCCLPMVFDGEEFSMGVRAWTHGYDLYAPCKSFAFHPYQRAKKPPMFWEQPDEGRQSRSENRIKAILGMPVEEDDYDKTDIQRYGLGAIRPLQTYLTVFGINLQTREVKSNCAEAFSGALHDRLHAFLRHDGRGIDYNNVYIPAQTSTKHHIERKKETFLLFFFCGVLSDSSSLLSKKNKNY
ncbi:hypothetical protein RFI_19662 [Reticulomyxa filosa]|uniref:Uncharacterized protein n=1 Tax=Reticulomyxa filosa TaxID=46433 RepID=X6MW17_RETFI|nr:hypothetical protein RFI_19662 [Reticulomyxa filosa]|eukprot:ETO17657.1 hypothetical protein RFI_19662 [Reticulomyxa filosa]